MPLVRISVLDDTPAAERRAIGEAVHAALVEVAHVSESERFQVISGCPAESFHFDGRFGGVERRRVVLVEITMVGPVNTPTKRQLYRRIAAGTEPFVRPDDLFIVLTENGLADWSEDGGAASLLARR